MDGHNQINYTPTVSGDFILLIVKDPTSNDVGTQTIFYLDDIGVTVGEEELVIVEENNFYPFGMVQKGYNNVVNGTKNNYMTYNGKELNESLGLNIIEMDMRQYDPAIARWTSIDPVVHFSMSTYNAFDNNPVYWADPSGANSETHYISKFLNKDGGHWSDQYRTDDDSDSKESNQNSLDGEMVSAFINSALNSDQDYSHFKIFSGEDDEKEAFAYMREFAERHKDYELAAWVTLGSIYVLSVDWDLIELANHEDPEIEYKISKRPSSKKASKQVSYATILKIGNTRVQLLAEAHTHYEDGSSSSPDINASRQLGVPVYSIGPRDVRVSNGMSFVYDVQRHNSTTRIFSTTSLLNGTSSIRGHSKSFLEKNNLLIKKNN